MSTVRDDLKKLHPELSDEQINKMVTEAEQQNPILGAIKFFYYISPLGWLLSNKEHNVVWSLVFA